MKYRNAPRLNRKKQAGFTALEITIVIIVGIIIIAAAGPRIAKMFKNNDLEKEVGHYSSLLMETKALRTKGSYGAVGTDLVPQLIAVDAVPKSMTVSSGTLKNSWDGTVTVVSTGSGFNMTVPALPKSDCIQLATKVSAGGAVTTTIGSGTAITGPVDNATATTDCAAATGNSIVFGMVN